ncbi:MAG TPA: rod shape-determining protein RodA [Gemmatimonadota bacterium]|nr:rod shape-determining protein RodA [Gemmatimonadota bacterium]
MSRVRLSPPHNWYLLGLALTLAGGGLLLLFSAGQTATGANADYWQLQLIWLFFALVAYAVIGFVPIRLLEKASWPLYVASVLLLVVVLALPEIGGARSWIRFGAIGFQPSEFAKVAAILVVARWVASLESPPRELTDLTTPALLIALPAGLTLLQPDLGTAMIFVLLLAGLCFWSGAPPVMVFLLLSPIVSILLTFSLPLWSLYIVGVGAILFLLGPGRGTWLYVSASNLLMGIVALPLWNALAGYQKQRLLVFLQPESDPRGAGWNVIQSKVAIGSGGWFGKGFLDGTQKRLAFLPERHTDFIFSVLGEELGFLGVLVSLTLFVLLLVEGVRIAERNPDAFASTAAFGLVVLIASHVTINTAMTAGLLPITGLPMPFLSRGGSFLVVCFVAVGLWRLVWYDRFSLRSR